MKSSKISGAVQEVILPDFPDDDNTVTTVTKSRRVSFGTNFVKEFIVGSTVSGQFLPEYEQAFPSSDSSTAESSHSGAESGFLENSLFVSHDSHKVHHKSIPPASQVLEPDTSESRPKLSKFLSTVCFSADSPTADVEFTEGCITLAKSILDKKNKEMTVIIQAKSKEEEKGKEDETKYFEGSQFEMSMTRCLKPKGNKREERRLECEKTKIFSKYDNEMSITRCNRIFDEDDSDESWEECKENRMPLDMIMRHLDKDNSDLENEIFNPEKTLSNFLNGGPSYLSNDSENLNLNESMDISMDLPNILLGSRGPAQNHPSPDAPISFHATTPEKEKSHLGSFPIGRKSTATFEKPSTDIIYTEKMDLDESVVLPLGKVQYQLDAPSTDDKINKSILEKSLHVPEPVVNPSVVEVIPNEMEMDESEHEMMVNENVECPIAEVEASKSTELSKTLGNEFEVTKPVESFIPQIKVVDNPQKATELEVSKPDEVPTFEKSVEMEMTKSVGVQIFEKSSIMEISKSAGVRLFEKSTEMDITKPAEFQVYEKSSVMEIIKPAGVEVLEKSSKIEITKLDEVRMHEKSSDMEMTRPAGVHAFENSSEMEITKPAIGQMLEKSSQIEIMKPTEQSPEVESVKALPAVNDESTNQVSSDEVLRLETPTAETHIDQMEFTEPESSDKQSGNSFEEGENTERPVEEESRAEVSSDEPDKVSMTEKQPDDSLSTSTSEVPEREPFLVDIKVIESLREQSKEPGCVWSLKDLRHPQIKTPGFLSFNCKLMESSFGIRFTLKISNEDSLDSCSLVTDSEVNLNEDEKKELRLPEYNLVVDFGFTELKKDFEERRTKVETIRHVPYFLDQINSYVGKINSHLRQIYSILISYPGSRLKGSELSFRLYSFPLSFSCFVSIDLSNLFRPSKSSLSFEYDFGSLDEKKIREIFERCRKRENSLCEFVVESTRYLIDLEKATGYVSKRGHVRLLPEELKL